MPFWPSTVSGVPLFLQSSFLLLCSISLKLRSAASVRLADVAVPVRPFFSAATPWPDGRTLRESPGQLWSPTARIVRLVGSGGNSGVRLRRLC